MKTAMCVLTLNVVTFVSPVWCAPVMVKDLIKGTESSFPGQLVAYKGKLLFVAGRSLWSSDGTPDGTKVIAEGVSPSDLVAASDVAYFYSSSGTFTGSTGRIWKTNGTTGGTIPVKEVTPSGLASSFPTHPLVPFKNQIFFRGITSSTGGELWKSDGTSSGTKLIKDIFPGTSYSRPTDFVVAGNYLFFNADDGTHGNAIWKTDGTTAGTGLVFYGATFQNLTGVGNVLYYCFATGAFNSTGGRLWKSYGDGGYEVKQFEPFGMPYNMTNAGGVLFFAVQSQTYGDELWKSDGTSAGTYMVRDINEQFNASVQGPGKSNPTSLCSLGAVVYFSADNGLNGEELWRSDGTYNGTYMVTNINPNGHSSPRNLTQVGNFVYFTAYTEQTGRELWVTDGTAAGTRLVKDIYQGIQNSDAFNLVNVNGNLFFTANDGIHGFELWTSNAPSKPEIALEQPLRSNLTDGESKRSFGTAKVGSKGLVKTFTIRNLGSATLTGLAITNSGSASKDFVLSSPTKRSLPAGATATFKVSFKPKAKGIRNASIQIKSNDANENPFTFKITGRGVSK